MEDLFQLDVLTTFMTWVSYQRVCEMLVRALVYIQYYRDLKFHQGCCWLVNESSHHLLNMSPWYRYHSNAFEYEMYLCTCEILTYEFSYDFRVSVWNWFVLYYFISSIIYLTKEPICSRTIVSSFMY